ncbi:stage VI sporulation protein D [Aneurinibacillus soli]|uniref:Stage VI sporulation protein D n=1 Tax=Aneurinibacillus soli TaxID=1500254 RepID=A0A0U5B7Q1_9BACL|nr:LysM peptidoglycan-binding domain-containing protein [Aneurinibacillus soli]PYE62409.1 stage VI sporulation protein D [Aneurinibacillus soli]BAU26972.1 Stage VI sporulation protein D [Aneurinibacillus soli]
MQNNRKAVLAFPVQHSIFIPQDQNEIEQIDEIELTPNIHIEEVVDEVIVSGYLKLEGTYTGRPPKFPDIPENENGVPLTGYVDSVVFNPFAMDPDDFPSESETTPFEQKIPVHIRIARDKISAMDDLYAAISAFDYDIQSARKLTITAELVLNGIQQTSVRQPEMETHVIPTSFEYTLPMQETEEEGLQEQAEEQEPEAKQEIVPELISFTPEPAPEPVSELIPEIIIKPKPDRTEAAAEVPPELVEEVSRKQTDAPSLQKDVTTVQAVQKEESDPDPNPQIELVSAEIIQPPVQEEEQEPEVKQEIVPEPISFTPEPASEIIVKSEPDRAEVAAEVPPELVKEVSRKQTDAPALQDDITDVKEEGELVREEKEMLTESAPELKVERKPELKPKLELKAERDPEPELEPEANRDLEMKLGSELEGDRDPESDEEPEDAKVSITLKGTRRDPVTVTTGLLSSVAATAEAEKRAEEVQAEENRISQQEREARAEEEKAARALREDALYLTNFMNKTEETFARLKMCIAQKDETLEEIADRYNITAAEVAEANGLHTNSTVARGQVLYIPVRG